MLFHMSCGSPIVAIFSGAKFLGKISIRYDGAGISCLEFISPEKNLRPDYFCTGCASTISVAEVGSYCTDCGRLVSIENMRKSELPGIFLCDDCIKNDPETARHSRKLTDLLAKISLPSSNTSRR